VPLLVLWGEADPWTPVQAAKLYRSQPMVPPIQVTVLPRTGHCPHDERPELVNPCILAWLQQQELPDAGGGRAASGAINP
jgi:pimeloyl-ACP methyl ester carboxylesterase